MTRLLASFPQWCLPFVSFFLAAFGSAGASAPFFVVSPGLAFLSPAVLGSVGLLPSLTLAFFSVLAAVSAVLGFVSSTFGAFVVAPPVVVVVSSPYKSLD